MSKKAPVHKTSQLLQQEWENILTLLLNENSIGLVAGEMLAKMVSLTNSDMGIVFYFEDSLREEKAHISYLPEGSTPDNIEHAISEISPNLNYISQWLRINRHSLSVTADDTENIGHNLISIIKKNNVVVVPGFIKDNLLYAAILAKDKAAYSEDDIAGLEQFASVLAFSLDNLKTRNLNAALESKLMQSQKLETIGKLASGMAHDFNNLLSNIFGSLNLLKKRLTDRPDLDYLVENIENSSARAADLTKGLLSYGKATPKRKTLIKPAELIRELKGVLTQTFPETHKLLFDTGSELHDIMGNATEIYQVLLNMCINAKEAIRETGSVTVSTNNFVVDDRNGFDFPLLDKGDYVCFSIKDTGDGISEENLIKIFDPYFSTKKKETVSGLGLYVTYGIVKAHKGYIDVKSKQGQGTTFTIYIPAYKKEAPPVPQDKSEKIIILADDEIMLRDLLAELLESYNYQVIAVQNGVEALQVITEEIKADLLIIDYNMPVMDGLTCIQKIREIGLEMPVILSTGSTSASDDKVVQKLKIDMILNKPYEFEVMLDAVQKLI